MQHTGGTCGTHQVSNQLTPEFLIKLKINGGGNRGEELDVIFKQFWFATQAMEAATQTHTLNSEGNSTEWEWAAGN